MVSDLLFQDIPSFKQDVSFVMTGMRSMKQELRIGDCDQIEAFKNFRSFIGVVSEWWQEAIYTGC